MLYLCWTFLASTITSEDSMTIATTALSRRRFLTTSATVAAAAYFAPSALFAQAGDAVSQMRASGATAKISTQKLRGNVSVLMGSGGNILVLPGTDGKLLVDSGFATSRPQITEALAAISNDPIKHLVDTHWHFDHTDGNEWLHAAGATIIAHENTRKRLSTPQQIAAFNAHFPPAPAGALPTIVFSQDKTITTNGETLHLAHFSPAHTDSDISVHFAKANIIHAGDTWFHGVYPFIDYSSGGNINGMITATALTLSRADNETILIPGHGPVGNKAQLTADHEMLVAIRDNVAALKKQGKSVEEAIAAKPTASFDAKYATGGIVPPDTFTRLVYAGV